MTIPDAASFDWEAEAAKELANVDRNQTVVAFGFGNGVFERLAALMGFEEALLAIMEEPEEVFKDETVQDSVPDSEDGLWN